MTNECTCEWCGRTFERPHHRGPAPRFCSPSHRQRAHEARTKNRSQPDSRYVNVFASKYPDQLASLFANLKPPDLSQVLGPLNFQMKDYSRHFASLLANIKGPDLSQVLAPLRFEMKDYYSDLLASLLADIKGPDLSQALAPLNLQMKDYSRHLASLLADIKGPDLSQMLAPLHFEMKDYSELLSQLQAVLNSQPDWAEHSPDPSAAALEAASPQPESQLSATDYLMIGLFVLCFVVPALLTTAEVTAKAIALIGSLDLHDPTAHGILVLVLLGFALDSWQRNRSQGGRPPGTSAT